MAFASFDDKRNSAPMAEINMVPLIDVMLVLLVIFIVTAPLLSHSVKLELPKASTQVMTTKAEKVDLSIDANGMRYWNGQPLSREDSVARFAAEGAKAVQPDLLLRADQAVPYKAVAEALADASRAGLTRINFVTDPELAAPAPAPAVGKAASAP